LATADAALLNTRMCQRTVGGRVARASAACFAGVTRDDVFAVVVVFATADLRVETRLAVLSVDAIDATSGCAARGVLVARAAGPAVVAAGVFTRPRRGTRRAAHAVVAREAARAVVLRQTAAAAVDAAPTFGRADAAPTGTAATAAVVGGSWMTAGLRTTPGSAYVALRTIGGARTTAAAWGQPHTLRTGRTRRSARLGRVPRQTHALEAAAVAAYRRADASPAQALLPVGARRIAGVAPAGARVAAQGSGTLGVATTGDVETFAELEIGYTSTKNRHDP
jgi:hypothetical protein